MQTTHIPKFMNALMADLQADAWSRGVKLVADVSTGITLSLDQKTLRHCLFELLEEIIRQVSPGSAISVVTGFEPAATAVDPGLFKLQILAPVGGSGAVGTILGETARCVQSHGGELESCRTAEAWGLTIVLPWATLSPSHQTTLPHRTAVVVDDDVDTQELITTILESQGFRVIAVNDGFDALVVIERYRPDVVLTDILMPNMNGLDLVARIKAYRADLPVIVFSGYRDTLVGNIRGLPDRILPKPMSRADLLDALTAVLPG